MIYMDNGATTKMHPKVIEKMLEVYEKFPANPSSVHTMGQEAKGLLESTRLKIAELLNVKPKEIYFTSGGTESDNWALRGFLNSNSRNHIITSKIEHSAILNTTKYLATKGIQIDLLNVDRDGFIEINQLMNLINKKTVLISIMAANNEIGTIQNISEISKIARENDIIFHSDMVQSFGNIDLDFKLVDSASISAHKFKGPKGVGIFYLKDKIPINNIIFGGSQERGYRAGTENLASIVGMATAIELKLRSNIKKTESMRNYLIKELKSKGYKINGSLEKRLPGNINFILDGIPANISLMKLDLKGICVSAGSACTAGSIKPSHVLKAIGLEDEQPSSSIRITIDDENTFEEINYLLECLDEMR